MVRPELHDAVLLQVLVKWAEAAVEMTFRVDGPRNVILAGKGLSGLVCPHEAPWGPSESVNEVRGPIPVGNKLQRVEVEMQSGDTITVQSAAFEWR